MVEMEKNKNHWGEIYKSKSPGEVSWYQPRLATSLGLILESGIAQSAEIIDIGGGASTLADDLFKRGYEHITVLDISSEAIQRSKIRLGQQAKKISWVEKDIFKADFSEKSFDLWHDCALFHFLTQSHDRWNYVALANKVLKPGGCLIVATFGPGGPTQCSGLDTVRYSPESLHQEFDGNFELKKSLIEKHHTPGGKPQEFVYCLFRKILS